MIVIPNLTTELKRCTVSQCCVTSSLSVCKHLQIRMWNKLGGLWDIISGIRLEKKKTTKVMSGWRRAG